MKGRGGEGKRREEGEGQKGRIQRVSVAQKSASHLRVMFNTPHFANLTSHQSHVTNDSPCRLYHEHDLSPPIPRAAVAIHQHPAC